ncbi:hypothetical protein FUAX_40920 (plasmid) [Fulvitalea axinellae]|uniref:Terminase ATPase subunit N-terminal domain-containing protein n=1 Tax=Fulvitalea axinellae TaxID=1182444 RepID=A0AAU9CQJ7_9BACT|nr:hypothetical protein FUAX_40920 [Fulvitalea axinellae]
MGKYDKKRELAQGLYIKGTLSKKEIAKFVGVTDKTLRTWAEKYAWDQLKEAQSVTRQQLLADAYAQLKAVNQAVQERGGVPDKALTDAKSVLRKEIEQLSDSPLHLYVEIYTEVSEWLVEQRPDKAGEVSKLFLEFLDEKHEGA